MRLPSCIYLRSSFRYIKVIPEVMSKITLMFQHCQTRYFAINTLEPDHYLYQKKITLGPPTLPL